MKRCSQTFTSITSASASHTTSTSACTSASAPVVADEDLSINLLHIRDAHRLLSAESVQTCEPDTNVGVSESLSDDDVSVSRRTQQRSTLRLDSVDLWEDSNSDSERQAATTAMGGLLATTTNAATQTSLTITHEHQTADRHRSLATSHNQHITSCRLSPQTTSVVDACGGSNWQSTSFSQVSAASTAASVSHGFIPSIIESSGRPSTANTAAADLSHGSVDLLQRPVSSGLKLFIRSMRLRLTENGAEHSTSAKSEVKVTESKVTRLNDMTIDRLYLSSRL